MAMMTLTGLPGDLSSAHTAGLPEEIHGSGCGRPDAACSIGSDFLP
jgi:hypothetical protein